MTVVLPAGPVRQTIDLREARDGMAGLAQVDERTLLINLLVLVALLILAVVGFVVLVASWTGLKIGIWHFRRKRAERQEQQRKQRPEDKASLPVGRGLCDRCGTPSREVLHLPSGERCCPDCYRQFFES